MPSTNTKEKPKTHITVQKGDIEVLIYMLEGTTERFKIINYIKKYLLDI